jgi:hypothetical protein
MFTLFRRLLFGPPPPTTRMTEEEVRVLADKAVQAARINQLFGRVSVRSIEGRLTWIVSTSAKGSGWSVWIDDATGDVGPVRRWGIR